MENGEFYIGWKTKAPHSIAKFVRNYLLILLPLVIGLAILLSLSQKPFGTGNFEFGRLTTIQGVYLNKPVPSLKIIAGNDNLGNSHRITFPLVGYGKHGAEGIIADIEREKNVSMDQKEVTLKGTLLYNDGKTILQIDKNDNPVLNIGQAVRTELLPEIKELGNVTVRGEIIDVKCYFGVMKPGEGKAHRDCAIRCILGGIPPALSVQNEKGERNYFLLVGPHGEKINEMVQPYAGRPVEVNARAVQYDDWIVLYLNTEKDIAAISRSGLFQPAPAIACTFRICN